MYEERVFASSVRLKSWIKSKFSKKLFEKIKLFCLFITFLVSVSSIAHLFLRIEVFSANFMLKALHMLNENLVFDRREVCWPSFIAGLSAKLYGRVIFKLPSYWAASNRLFDCNIQTVSLCIKFEQKHMFAFKQIASFLFIFQPKTKSRLIVFFPRFHH